MKTRYCKDCLYCEHRKGGLYCVAKKKGTVVDIPVRELSRCTMGYTKEDFALLDKVDYFPPAVMLLVKYGAVKKVANCC